MQLDSYWIKHSDCEQQLKSWYREAAKSEWKNTNEIKREYPTAIEFRISETPNTAQYTDNFSNLVVEIKEYRK